MLFAPFRERENVLKIRYNTWEETYLANKPSIDQVEQNFMAKVKRSWGDIDMASKTIEPKNENLFNILDF